MKALTDKIIDALNEIKDATESNDYKHGIKQAIHLIEKMEKEADFEEVARVMMKHLGDPQKYHPHITVITTNSTCELMEGQKSVGHVMDYVPD